MRNLHGTTKRLRLRDFACVLFSALNISEEARVTLGIYRGLRFGIMLRQQFPPEVYLEDACSRRYRLSRKHHEHRAVPNARERLARGYGSECVREELSIAESQLRDYQARLGKPFTREASLLELTALRDQVESGTIGRERGVRR